MQEAVLSIGTFDPYHDAHLKQLEYAYAVRPFERAVIAVSQDDPKKPHAAPWHDRVTLAELAVKDKKLPFTIFVIPIGHATTVVANELRTFAHRHLTGYRVIRAVGSDTIQTFAADPTLHPLLTAFDYVVMIRPMAKQAEFSNIIAALPEEVSKNFSYQIAHDWGDILIAATDVRQDIQKAYTQGYITKFQLEYITQKRLYHQRG